jgi:hypothetical protein
MEGRIMYIVSFRYRDLTFVMHEIADALTGCPVPRGSMS